MSSYTDTRTATQNGLIEWDAVDSNVNMPILNYKVNVNLPVYDVPAVYTPLQIQTNNNYVLGDFVNDNVTDYTWLHKNIPVTINVGSAIPKLKYISYNSVSYTKSNFTQGNIGSSFSLANNKVLIYYRIYTDNIQIGMCINKSGSNITLNITTDYYLVTNFGTDMYGVYLRDSNTYLAWVFDNVTIDSNGTNCKFYNSFLDYSEFV